MMVKADISVNAKSRCLDNAITMMINSFMFMTIKYESRLGLEARYLLFVNA
jgi:hypothetical protein